MQFMMNDRFFNSQQEIKMIVIDDAAGQLDAPTSVVDFDIKFEIFNEDWEPQDVSIEVVDRLPYREGIPFVPSAARRLAGSTLKPGLYHIRSSNGSLLVGSRDFVILPDDVYRRTLNSIIKQTFSTEEHSFDFTRSWRHAWEQVLAYSAVSSTPHILVKASLPPITARYNDGLYDLGRDAYEWASFHLNRLAFDRAMFGGKVTVYQSFGASATVSVRIMSAFRQTPIRRIPQYISALINSFDNGMYTASIILASHNGTDEFILDSSIDRG